MIKSKFLISFFLIPALALQGCAKFEPVPMPLTPVEEYPYSAGQGEVDVRVLTYTREEIKEYFASDLPKKNIWPVRVFVQNNSNKTYIFTKGYIEPGQISSHEASRKGRRKAGWRLAWGLIFWATFFGIPIAIPLFVTGCQALGANNYMTRKYVEWEVVDTELKPGHDFAGIIFFQSPQLPTEFTISLLEQETNTKLQIPVSIAG